MAILGTLDMLLTQTHTTLLKQSIDYLLNTDLNEVFTQVSPDHPLEIEINGRSVYAIFNKYETKDIVNAKMEGHRKYIDIQYIHSGVEQILVAPISKMVKEVEYDQERDLHFPRTTDYSSFRLTAGMGCILYPEDLHAPCISIDTPTKVEKIVIKVAVD